jgi:integrase
VRLDGHPPATKSFTSKAAARAWAGEVEAEMRNGRYAAGSGRTLAEAISGYEGERLTELRDQGTTQIHLDWWRRRLGGMRLRELSVMAVADAVAELAKEAVKPKTPGSAVRRRSPATLNRYKATLSAVLKWCQRRGWISDNVARHVAARTENNERVRFLTPDERVRLLAACKASPTEALHLRWSRSWRQAGA